jgi:hypothetical protein
MWRGFVTESKSYMNYPNCGRWNFWKRFPRAFVIFYWMTFDYWVQIQYFKICRWVESQL